MRISVRLLQPHEVDLANNFFNTIYRTNRSLENFKWEFLNGPCGKAIYVIAVDDTVTNEVKIVGIQSAIPLEMINEKGQIVLTAKSEDTLVDPDYRGQKIFEKMYQLLFVECTRAGIKYIWGFTPAQKAFERIGFEIPFLAEQALLVLDPIIAYRYLKLLNKENTTIDRLKIFMLCLLSWIKHFKFSFQRCPLISKAQVDGKTELFKKFYHDTNLFTLNQSLDYTNWRIKSNPFQNQYESYQLYESGIKADVIINFRGKVGYIEQMLAKNIEVLAQFLPAVLKKFRAEKVALVRTMCFSANDTLKLQVKVLKKNGFIHLKRGNYYVWNPLTAENLIQPEQLFITRLFTQGNL